MSNNSEKFLMKFINNYKLIFAIILILNQVNNSTQIKNNTDLVYLKNDHYEYFLSSVLNRYKRQLTNNKTTCQIPNNPLHTKYNIFGNLQTSYKPGDYVHAASVLETSCDKGYNLISPFAPKYSICVNGNWEPSLTTCRVTCPSLTSTTSTTVKCKYQGIALANCVNPVYETRVTLSCNTLYEETSLERNPIRVCRNGMWNPSVSQCYPSCGMKSPKGTANIVNGTNATPGDYPWQVLEIHVPEKYKGQIHFFAHDIAIIILTDPFRLSQVVQPVCVELNEEIQQLDLSLNSNGTVTGWGQTEEGRVLSEVLKELIVPYVPYDKCFNEVPENFRRYITFDKICGGYTNIGTSICGGDSGGALTFKNVVNNRYYVKGIVSTSPASSASSTLACDSNSYSLYTEISNHINFVRDLVQYYQTPQSIVCTQEDCTNQEIGNLNRCTVPNFPPNGKYILLHQNGTAVPGDYVPMQSVLTISCNTGYEAYASNKTQSYCVGTGQWIPAPGTCKEIVVLPQDCLVAGEVGMGSCININSCKPILDYLQASPTISNQASTALRKYQCGFEGRSPKVCCYANKSIQISMEDFEMQSTSLPNIANHKNINLLPNECGLYSIKKRIVGGIEADLFEFPWMALLIYKTAEDTTVVQHSGTIINERYILTAAQTIHTRYQELVGVRVGEYNLTSERDCELEGENITVCADPVQDIQIEEAIPHPNFNRSTSSNDIGLIRLRTPMQFKRSVQPICLPISDAFRIENYTNTRLQITGWGYTTSESYEQSSVLLKAAVTVVSELDCRKFYRNTNFRNSIIGHRYLCAGGQEADSCQGDAGGPLQGTKLIMFPNQTVDDLQYVQYGITSSGKRCGIAPSIYTRIDYFMDWILDNIKI